MRCTTLLDTARVTLCSKSGDSGLFRDLIDFASEASFVTERAVQLLALKRKPLHTMISGVGGEVTARSQHAITLSLKFPVDPAFC